MKRSIKRIGTLCYAILLSVSIVIFVSAEKDDIEKVYLGGMPFGVRFDAGEVVVLKTNTFISSGTDVSPAENAGICSDDIIKSIEGTAINSMADVMTAIQSSNKEVLEITVLRNGKELKFSIKPMLSDDTGVKQLGVLLKDSSAGIGTVTYVNNDALSFAGLGHGICDASDGKLLKIKNGYVSNVVITDVNKGKIGIPGELKGDIDSQRSGKLISNTEVGVFGVFTSPPPSLNEKIEIAEKEELKPGKAKILCTLDDNQRREYEVEISRIQNYADAKTKNFIVKVTDKTLLSKTGGIVQGMSGSPIIQNGKLVGAVTHVLVNDPTTGYGIFIENMLEESA